MRLTDAEVDSLLERFDQTEPAIQRRIIAKFIGDRMVLLAALKGVVALADRAHTHWDADEDSEDSKVGKILAAMAGHLKGYNPEATAIHAAIALAESSAD